MEGEEISDKKFEEGSRRIPLWTSGGV